MAYEIYCIDPAVHTPEKDTYLKIKSLAPKPFRMSYHLPALENWQKILEYQKKNPPQAVIILGSSSSVYDQSPWQDMLRTWIQKLIDHQVPLLGICYGHQLILHLFGSKICSLPQKQMGSRIIKFSNTSFLKKTAKTMEVVVSHQEIVMDLPKEFITFASSFLIPIEATYHRSLPIFTIQGHPEATALFCKNQAISLHEDHLCFRDGSHFLKSILSIFYKYIKKRG